MQQRIKTASDYIRQRCGETPTVGIILGSGLGAFPDRYDGASVIPYADIPGFPAPTVEGHSGHWITFDVGDKRVVAMQGRFHSYEGHSMEDVTLPVRVMHELGVRTLIVTCAAGAVNETFDAGDLMVISDHIMLGDNPLRGPNLDEYGPRFPDMTDAYDPNLRALCFHVASELKYFLREGVYMFMRGPSFETPAEIRMARVLGADAVGMSTVPEVITARHMGINTLGIALISNMAAGILQHPLSHAEVLEAARDAKPMFESLMDALIRRIIA